MKQNMLCYNTILYFHGNLFQSQLNVHNFCFNIVETFINWILINFLSPFSSFLQLHSEYRSTYRWHEYTGGPDVVRKPPVPNQFGKQPLQHSVLIKKIQLIIIKELLWFNWEFLYCKRWKNSIFYYLPNKTFSLQSTNYCFMF